MDLREFVIGELFWTHTGAFRCTDIGSRVVVAVQLGPRKIATAERVDGAPDHDAASAFRSGLVYTSSRDAQCRSGIQATRAISAYHHDSSCTPNAVPCIAFG